MKLILQQPANSIIRIAKSIAKSDLAPLAAYFTQCPYCTLKACDNI